MIPGPILCVFESILQFRSTARRGELSRDEEVSHQARSVGREQEPCCESDSLRGPDYRDDLEAAACPHVKDVSLRTPTKHSRHHCVRYGQEVRSGPHVVLKWTEALVRCEFALGHKSRHKTFIGGGGLLDREMPDSGVRGHSTSRNRAFKPTDKSPRILDRELASSHVAD